VYKRASRRVEKSALHAKAVKLVKRQREDKGTNFKASRVFDVPRPSQTLRELVADGLLL
jgi:hypothetical protein